MKRTFVWLLVLCSFPSVFALDTTFTYQGRLNDSNGPASGTYDFRFVLFDSITKEVFRHPSSRRTLRIPTDMAASCVETTTKLQRLWNTGMLRMKC